MQLSNVPSGYENKLGSDDMSHENKIDWGKCYHMTVAGTNLLADENMAKHGWFTEWMRNAIIYVNAGGK